MIKDDLHALVRGFAWRWRGVAEVGRWGRIDWEGLGFGVLVAEWLRRRGTEHLSYLGCKLGFDTKSFSYSGSSSNLRP